MIEPMFSDSDLDRWTQIFQEKAHRKLHTMLDAAGEMFVKYARESGNYKDQTGNLRSSIGYVVVLDGKIINDNFKKSGSGTDGEDGLEKGGKLAQQVAAIHNEGFILIGVAGMEYAVYVEAIDSLDVITGASIRTNMWLKEAIITVFEKANG